MKTLNTDNRYLRDQHDDGKSGYRTVTLTDRQLEDRIVNALVCRGGMPVHLLMAATGENGVRMFLALGRLQAKGHVNVDRHLLVTFNAPVRLSLWRRLMNKFNGGIHPALVLIVCVGATTAACIAFT